MNRTLWDSGLQAGLPAVFTFRAAIYVRMLKARGFLSLKEYAMYAP